MDRKLPDIFQYIDYRKYLEDYRILRKEWDEGFTHSYICFKLGQRNSRTLFRNILTGKRNLTSEFIKRFIILLELKEAEAQYFRVLVLYNQSTDVLEKELYFDQLVQMNHTPKVELGEEYSLYYSKWYHSAVRAILDIHDFSSGYSKLAETLNPEITADQAKESISLLRKLKLIKKNKEGFYKPTDKAISSGGNSPFNPYIKKYQLQCLDQAKLAVMNDNPDFYKTATLTLSISDEGFKRIVKRTEQYRKELFAIVNKDEKAAEKVYHINIQMMAQSK